jgi:hypothetical protein
MDDVEKPTLGCPCAQTPEEFVKYSLKRDDKLVQIEWPDVGCIVVRAINSFREEAEMLGIELSNGNTASSKKSLYLPIAVAIQRDTNILLGAILIPDNILTMNLEADADMWVERAKASAPLLERIILYPDQPIAA